MKPLNKHHREIFVGKLKDLFDKKDMLQSFSFRMLKDKQEAKSEREQEACQASIDSTELEIEFAQDQIERIQDILINNHL